MSPMQKDLVLECIASHANTLNQLLMLLQQEKDGFASGALIDAAQLLSQTLGAMADDATGGAIIGDMRRWLYGPLFETHGAVTVNKVEG